MKSPIWTPSQERIDRALSTRFIELVDRKEVTDFKSLYHWSCQHRDQFWGLVWDFCGVIGEKGDRVLTPKSHMLDDCWFEQARLNYTENLLRRRDDSEAIVFRSEDQLKNQRLTYAELYRQVASFSRALRSLGVKKGDVVAGVLPNLAETMVAALATASIGAIWTSASADFGLSGLYDRFGQVQPKVLIGVDGYLYHSKKIITWTKLKKLKHEIKSIKHLIIIQYLKDDWENSIEEDDQSFSFDSLLKQHACDQIQFERVAFDHPLFILYSSGTTGKPKCIVHGTGGTLLQHLKEHQLHCDIQVDDRVFYFTTCGWMMWNWLVSVLASRASVMLYEGSVFYPDEYVLWNFAEEEKFTFFGTSAKYLQLLAKKKLSIHRTHPLKSLKTIASTGSVLASELFSYVYASVKRDINLASISGGTDIISCFVLGSSVLPVYSGELQTRGLGMAVEVFDSHGKRLVEQKGELICRASFPSMPVAFWNDPDFSLYKKAYFSQFDRVWCHGDYVLLTLDGGAIIYGRSDTTLNPGGVRIGTAEIYRQVENMEEVLEAVVVGQDEDQDVRVVLFVVLKAGIYLSRSLEETIRKKIKEGCSPRHVPSIISQVKDIPKTLSGKISEIAVRNLINGKKINNQDALSNQESLEIYRHWYQQHQNVDEKPS